MRREEREGFSETGYELLGVPSKLRPYSRPYSPYSPHSPPLYTIFLSVSRADCADGRAAVAERKIYRSFSAFRLKLPHILCYTV